MAIIYIETNFLMSITTGREAEAIMLLRDLSSSVQLVIPSICYMEALSALEDELKRQNYFKEQLTRQVSETKRDVTSEHAASLSLYLEESLISYRYRVGEIKSRLREAICLMSRKFRNDCIKFRDYRSKLKRNFDRKRPNRQFDFTLYPQSCTIAFYRNQSISQR